MKAVALLSGGLDSVLAIRVVQELSVDVIPLHFYTGFTGKNTESFKRKVQEDFGIKEPIIIDCKEEFLDILKNPKYGYGKNMNPCIDCKIFFFKKAKEIMKELGASFVISGEVLGQRPMSQKIEVFNLIEKEADLRGLILRPLTALNLRPSIPEEKGWIPREKLLSIKGRGRKKQMELAKKFRLKYIPSPAGGCILTDPSFSKRLSLLFNKKPEATWNEIELIESGRMFKIKDALFVVSRDDRDKQRLKRHNHMLTYKRDVIGVFLDEKDIDEDVIKTAAAILLRYSKDKQQPVIFNNKVIHTKALDPADVHKMLIGGTT